MLFDPAQMTVGKSGVPRIVDGDTLAIGATKVRLEGIDAPETDQVCLNANGVRLKTDARNAVGIIGGDKAKTQTYCQIVDLGRQMNQAVGEKNQKKARALAQEIVELRNQLPEFVVLENVVKHGLNSPDGREIALIIHSLNQSCPE